MTNAGIALPMDCDGLLSAVACQDLGAVGGERQRCNVRDDEREVIAAGGPVVHPDAIAMTSAFNSFPVAPVGKSAAAGR